MDESSLHYLRFMLSNFSGPVSFSSVHKSSDTSCLSSQVHIANQCEVGGLRLAAAGDQEVQAPGALEAVAAMVAPLPALSRLPRAPSSAPALCPGSP